VLDFDLKPDNKKLRFFGLFALVGFGVLGAVCALRGHLFGLSLGAVARPLGLGLIGLGAVSAFFSAVAPAANRPLYVLLTIVTYPIGLVVSFALLAAFFYGLITPIGLVFRLLGRDPLTRAIEREKGSYWIDAGPPAPPRRYFRQF
jgi:hypothetical protein